MHVKIFIYGVYFVNAHGCKYTFLYVMFYYLVENSLYHFNKINVFSEDTILCNYGYSQEWCLLVCSCFVIMRHSYPHKGRGGALNGDIKNSCKGDDTSSLRVAAPSPRQRGEALSGGGCCYTWASFS